MAFKRKICSRKFWTAVAGLVTNIMVAAGHSESEVTTVTALIMSGAVVIAYIVGEGLVDAAAAAAPIMLPEISEVSKISD